MASNQKKINGKCIRIVRISHIPIFRRKKFENIFQKGRPFSCIWISVLCWHFSYLWSPWSDLTSKIIVGKQSPLPWDHWLSYGWSPCCLLYHWKYFIKLEWDKTKYYCIFVSWYNRKLLSENIHHCCGTSVQPMVGLLVVSPWYSGSSPSEIFHKTRVR